MKRIKWDVFFGNSSTEGALDLFAIGKYSFKELSDECWPKECKEAIKALKHKGYKKSIRAAKNAIRKHQGFSITELKDTYNCCKSCGYCNY